jgi:hypothetical protein
MITTKTDEPSGAGSPSHSLATACRSWSCVCASLLFSAATFEMLVLSGIVHWQIMFRMAVATPRPPEGVCLVLEHLGWLRIIFAVLAFVWSLWSFRSSPRWAAIIALVISLVALMTIWLIT